MGAAHFRIKNWERFQHYNKPRPAWIKLHRTLLDDRDFQALSSRSRALLVMLWLIAAESDNGTIPGPKDIAWRLRLPEGEVSKDLQALTSYLEPLYYESRAILASDRDREETETEREKTSFVRFSEDAFGEFWKLHPFGPKKDAREAYRKALKDGAPPDAELLPILERQLQERRDADASGEFCARLPHLCRWFTHHRWEDAPAPKRVNVFLDGEAS